jgi:hypothetical protein
MIVGIQVLLYTEYLMIVGIQVLLYTEYLDDIWYTGTIVY